MWSRSDPERGEAGPGRCAPRRPFPLPEAATPAAHPTQRPQARSPRVQPQRRLPSRSSVAAPPLLHARARQRAGRVRPGWSPPPEPLAFFSPLPRTCPRISSPPPPPAPPPGPPPAPQLPPSGPRQPARPPGRPVRPQRWAGGWAAAAAAAEAAAAEAARSTIVFLTLCAPTLRLFPFLPLPNAPPTALHLPAPPTAGRARPTRLAPRRLPAARSSGGLGAVATAARLEAPPTQCSRTRGAGLQVGSSQLLLGALQPGGASAPPRAGESDRGGGSSAVWKYCRSFAWPLSTRKFSKWTLLSTPRCRPLLLKVVCAGMTYNRPAEEAINRVNLFSGKPKRFMMACGFLMSQLG